MDMKLNINIDDTLRGKKKEEGLFDITSPPNEKDGFSGEGQLSSGSTTSYVVQALTRYITQKHSDNVSIK